MGDGRALTNLPRHLPTGLLGRLLRPGRPVLSGTLAADLTGAGRSKTPEGTAQLLGWSTNPVQVPDRLVDASIDGATLVVQGTSGQDEIYGPEARYAKRLIHEIQRWTGHSGAHVHSLSTNDMTNGS